MIKAIPRATAVTGVLLMLAPVLGVASTIAPSSAGAAPQTHLMMCNHHLTIRPSNYVLSCADANANFVNATWSTWLATTATGSPFSDKTVTTARTATVT